MNNKSFYTFLCSLVLLITLKTDAQKITPEEYVNQFKEIAMEEMRTHHIPASITLAQGCLESSFGNSRLAKEGNNHFGIKCKSSWTGKVIYEDDDAVGECFRAYDDAKNSYIDHSLFLKANQRYAFLFELHPGDYTGWANGLRQAGYATNPKYPQLLINMIARYNLAKYDSLVLGLYNGITKVNGILATRLKENETLEEIAMQNAKTERRLRKINDLEPGQTIEPGDIVYLNRKKRKATESYHTVAKGESLWEVSQEYGIKLKRLKKLNQLEGGEEVAVGQVLNMRHKTENKPQLNTEKANLLNDIIANENTIHYNGPTQIHIVQAGETLYGIAKMYRTSTDTLIALNYLTQTSVNLGQHLKVPINNYSNQNNTPTISTVVYHTVLQGETLYAISKKYDVAVDTIKTLNNMTDNSLNVGARIRVK